MCEGPGPYLFPQRRALERPWVGGSVWDRPLADLRSLAERAGVANFTMLRCRPTYATCSK
jgi:hypothetical protein